MYLQGCFGGLYDDLQAKWNAHDPSQCWCRNACHFCSTQSQAWARCGKMLAFDL